MLGIRQYKRSIRVVFGPLLAECIEGEGLRIAFEVTRTSRSDPDQGTIQIFNLSASTRNAVLSAFDGLQTSRRVILNTPLMPDAARGAALAALEASMMVRVFAGYGKVPAQIFQGNLVGVTREDRSGSTDFVTTLKAGDGLMAYREGYVNQAFGPGVTMETVRQVLQLSMGLAESADAAATVAVVAPQAVVTAAANGFMAAGKASKALDDLAEMYGLQ